MSKGLSRKAFVIGDEEHPLTGVGGPGREKEWFATPEFIERFKALALVMGIKRIAQQDAMPSLGTLWCMMEDSPEMRAAYDDARKKRQPIPRRLVGFDEVGEETIAEVCRLIRTGQYLSYICRREDMPAFRTVQRWRARHAEIDQSITEAEKERDGTE